MKKSEIRPEIWDIAKARAAKCAHNNRRTRGVEQDEIADDIGRELYPRQEEILALLSDGKTEEAEAVIRDAVRKAENAAVREARKTIRALVPYQVRQAKESGKIEGCVNGIVAQGKKDVVDKAYAALANDMLIWRHQWCNAARVGKCVRFTLKNLNPIDRQIGFLHLELGSWEKVAARMGLSEGDFRRKHLPSFKKNFAVVWHLVW